MWKKILYLLIVFVFFISIVPTTLATSTHEEYTFEVGIPGVVGAGESKMVTGLPLMIRKVIVGLYIVGAIMAFISLITAGFIYVTSLGNASKTKDAMDRVQKAFIGLLLLLGAYVILYTINPDLVVLPEKVFTPSETLKNMDIQEKISQAVLDAMDYKDEYDNNVVASDELSAVLAKLNDTSLDFSLLGDVKGDLKKKKIDPTITGVINCTLAWIAATPPTKPASCGETIIGPLINGHMVVNYNSCHDVGKAIDIEPTGIGTTDKEKKTEQQKCLASLRDYINRCINSSEIKIIPETRYNETTRKNDDWLHIQTADCPFSGPGS